MNSKKTSLFTKFTAGILVTLFVIPSFFLVIPPKKTEAGFIEGVGGVIAACTGITGLVTGFVSDKAEEVIDSAIGNAISSISGDAVPTKEVTDSKLTKNTTSIKQKEGCADAIAYALAKSLIAAMTRSIVDWINNGFEGDPLFISDPQGFFRDVLDQATGIFFIELGQTQICEPLRAPIIRLLFTAPYFERVQCTLSTVIQNIDDFYTDFRNGGWAAWIEINEPQNNIYGLAYLTADELQRQRAERAQLARDEVSQGQGFIGFKKCLEYAKETITYENDDGQVVSEERDTANCVKETTLTPGQVVAEQMKFVSTTSGRQAELADEINESIALIFDTLLKKLLTDGIASLTSSGGGNNQYYGSTDWSQPTTELQNVASTLQQIYADALEFAGIERLGLTVAPALNDAAACYLELDALEQARAVALSAQAQSSGSQNPVSALSTYRDTAISLQEKRNEYITLTANFPTDIGLINGATTTLQALIDRANRATTQQEMDQIMLDYAGTLASRLPSTDAVTTMQGKKTQFEYDLGYAGSSLEQCQNLKTTVFSPTPSASAQ